MPLTTSTIVKLASKLASLLLALSKESPLKKIAENEYRLAIYDLNMASEESNVREGLNRALTHLESAYAHYLPCITTWDIWDRDKVLWNKKTFANSMCLYIAIIHYVLGNISISQKWLIENLDDMGSIHFPTDILSFLSIKKEDEFYCKVFKEEYSKIENIISRSKGNWHSVWDYDPDNDYHLQYMCHYD